MFVLKELFIGDIYNFDINLFIWSEFLIKVNKYSSDIHFIMHGNSAKIDHNVISYCDHLLGLFPPNLNHP